MLTVPAPNIITRFNNPFVGLRPFEPDEYLLFFGRDIQINELIEKFRVSRFLSVIGNSGCGKSSLVRAGLIPKLRGGFLNQNYDQWQTAIMRPGNDPVYYLLESILKNTGQKLHSAALEKKITELRKEIKLKGSLPIINEVIKRSRIQLDDAENSGEAQTNLLILVDQFEELFDDELKASAENKSPLNPHEIEETQITFINTLLELAKQTEVPIYIIITMRSDFLGNCNQFFGLPEAMNNGQYLVPRLDREQRREAIERPVKLFGADIDNMLLNRLLNESDTALDELPVLQHAMTRTWENYVNKNPDAPEVITAHYENAGGMANALSYHANEIYNSLGDTSKQKICEIIFKSLTKVDEKGRRKRRPQELGSLVKLCRATLPSVEEDDVRSVIDRFREDGNSFLSPYKKKRLGSNGQEESQELFTDTEIDISHESLIRKWDKLNDSNGKGWITEEDESAKIFKRFSDNVKENSGLLQSADIVKAKTWQQPETKLNPNAVWAARYADNFDDVIGYISKSKRNRFWASVSRYSVFGIIAVLVLVGLVLRANYFEKQKELVAKQAEKDKQLEQVKRNQLEKEKELEQVRRKQLEKEKELEQERSNGLAQQLKTLKAEKEKNQYATRLDLIETQLAQIQIQQLPFYTSAPLSQNLKKQLVEYLLKFKRADPEKYDAILASINQASKAKILAASDPNKAYYALQKAKKIDHNFLVDSINKDLLTNYLFYKQKADVGYIGSVYQDEKKQFVQNPGSGLLGFLTYYDFKQGYYRNGLLDFGKWKEKDHFLRAAEDDDDETTSSDDQYTTDTAYAAIDSAVAYTADTVAATADSAVYTADSVVAVADTTYAAMDSAKRSAIFFDSLQDSTIDMPYTPVYSTYSSPDAVAFISDTSLMLIQSQAIFSLNTDSLDLSKSIFRTMLPDEFSFATALSPDGSLLITISAPEADKRRRMTLWSVGNLQAIKKIDDLTLQFPPEIYASDIKLDFTGRGNHFYIKYPKDSIMVYTIEGEKIKWKRTCRIVFDKKGTQNGDRYYDYYDGYDDTKLNYAMISANGNTVIALANNSRYLYIWEDGDTLTKKPAIIFDERTTVYISPSGKYILASSDTKSELFEKQLSGKEFVYKAKTLTASLREGSSAEANEFTRNKYRSYTIQGAAFLDDNNLLTFNSNGNVRLWMTNTAEQILKNNKRPEELIYSKLIDKYNDGFITLDELSKTDNYEELWYAVSYFLKKPLRAKKNDPAATEDLSKALSLFKEMNTVEKEKTKLSCQNYLIIDLVQNKLEQYTSNPDYSPMIQRMKHLLSFIDSAAISDEKDLDERDIHDMNEVKSIVYGEMAWLQLLNKEPVVAESSARKAWDYDSTSFLTLKHLPLSLLLNKKYNEAKKLYTDYVDKDFSSLRTYTRTGVFYNHYQNLEKKENVTYRDIYIEDINIMIRKKILSGDDPEIIKMLEFLKEE